MHDGIEHTLLFLLTCHDVVCVLARYHVAGALDWGGGSEDVRGDIARGCSFGRVEASTSEIVSLKRSKDDREGHVHGPGCSRGVGVEELAAFLAYCTHTVKNRRQP